MLLSEPPLLEKTDKAAGLEFRYWNTDSARSFLIVTGPTGQP
jgi:hypothetical protein